MKFDDKLKKEWKERLQAFYQTDFPKDDFMPLDLLQVMVEVTSKSGFEVAVLLSRKGRVEDLFVGTKSTTDVPPMQSERLGFNGYRLVHTHPSGNGRLSEPDLSLLKNERYDCVAALGVLNGQATDASVGILTADDRVQVLPFANGNYLNKYGIVEKILDAEKTYVKTKSKLVTNDTAKPRAVLVGVQFKLTDRQFEQDMAELQGLAQTAGIEVVGVLTQNRDKPDGRTYIGEGKVQQLKLLIQNTHANMAIFDDELTGSKQANLTDCLGVEILDRSMLILDIFAHRAQSREGKLQVLLAQMKYLMPRIGSMGRKNFEGSGIGLKGPGESKIELNRRLLEDTILRKERELAEVKKHRATARQQRLQSNRKSVSLVGYTNSGKSTLMNALSGAGVFVKDELFATLDTTTRQVWLKPEVSILLTDTVGFIHKLPHEFIHAFSGTLQESVETDLLLHVVDCSSLDYENQMATVEQVLKEIGAEAPVLTVFNKTDCCDKKTVQTIMKTAPKNAVFISALNGTNLETLKNKMMTLLQL